MRAGGTRGTGGADVRTVHRRFHAKLRGRPARVTIDSGDQTFSASSDCAALCELPIGAASGLHCIEIEIVELRAERNRDHGWIGMMSPESARTLAPPGRAALSVALTNNGRVYRADTVELNKEQRMYSKGDRLRMEFDAATHTLRWLKGGRVLAAAGGIPDGWHFAVGRYYGEPKLRIVAAAAAAVADAAPPLPPSPRFALGAWLHMRLLERGGAPFAESVELLTAKIGCSELLGGQAVDSESRRRAAVHALAASVAAHVPPAPSCAAWTLLPPPGGAARAPAHLKLGQVVALLEGSAARPTSARRRRRCDRCSCRSSPSLSSASRCAATPRRPPTLSRVPSRRRRWRRPPSRASRRPRSPRRAAASR